MRVGQPGVHRPHRHLDREREQEPEEQRDLHIERQRQLVPVDDLEARARLVVEIQHRDQHQERAEQRVEEELDRRVHAVRAAPDADDDEHRDQRAFEEHVEQHRVEGGKDAVQQARHDEERGEVLRDARLDHAPAGDHHQDGDEAVQQHEQQRNPVDAEVVVDVEALDPGPELDKLHRARRGIEAGPQRQRDQETDDGAAERDPAHRRIAIAGGEHRHAGDDRQPDGGGEQDHLRRNQKAKITTPISMVKAYW